MGPNRMKNIMTEDISLLDGLVKLYPDSAKRTLRIWLKQRRVSVDGVAITIGKHLVKKGSQIVVGKVVADSIKGVEALYEDDHLIIIDKPTGLLSVPLDREKAINALGILRDYYKNSPVFAVHRIDKETSGVLVFAKTEEAKEGMDVLFRKHDLTREYIALVEGFIETPKGSWQSYLFERSHFEVGSTTDPKGGRLSITHYEVIRKTPKCTWLRLTLETGRKHQIRVHCRDAGYTILGDKRYGSTMNPYKRLCLHAHRIAFRHPITGEQIDIKAKPVSFIPVEQEDLA